MTYGSSGLTCRLKQHQQPRSAYLYLLPSDATQSAALPWQVCPSFRLSVTLGYRGHIGWNSWKIISRLTSPTFSLSADSNATHPQQREHPQILAAQYIMTPSVVAGCIISIRPTYSCACAPSAVVT